MKCTSCGTKEFVYQQQSYYFPNVKIFLCGDCHFYEPRQLVILAGRVSGINRIKHSLITKRYHGEDILAKELV